MNNINKELSPEAREALLKTLQSPFREEHAAPCRARVGAGTGEAGRQSGKAVVAQRNGNGGEPDVVGRDEKTAKSSSTMLPQRCTGAETSVTTVQALD